MEPTPCTSYSNLAFFDELDGVYHSAETQDVAKMFHPQLDDMYHSAKTQDVMFHPQLDDMYHSAEAQDVVTMFHPQLDVSGMVAGTRTRTDSATAIQAARLPPTLSQDAFNVFDIQLLPPEHKEISEKYNFEISIMEKKSLTNKYLQKPGVSELDPNIKVSRGVIFSPLFNKIYVSMDNGTKKYLKIKFEYGPATDQPLFVRLTPAFAEEYDSIKRVEICSNHRDMIKNKEPKEACNHLIHSVSTHNAVHYLGDPSQPKSHYSVVVDFNNTTEKYLWHEFKFVCANSCAKENKGETILIYELLDAFGHVYSRKIMNLCICQNISRAYKTDLEKPSKANLIWQEFDDAKQGVKRSMTISGESHKSDRVEKKRKKSNCKAKKRRTSLSTTQNDRIPVDINGAQSANVSYCTKEILEAHINVITALAASINDSEVQSDYKTFLQKLQEHQTNMIFKHVQYKK